MQRIVRIPALAAVVALLAQAEASAAPGRNVEIRWDFRKAPPKQLEVWVDCKDVSADLTSCLQPDRVVGAPQAYRFELKRGDKVTLVTIGEKGKDPGSADYAVTGTDLDTKDLEQLKKLVTGAVAGAQVKGPPATQRQLEAPAVYVGVVTDKLIAGGKLTATFNLKKTTGAGTGATETVTATSGALTFNVLPESPRITVSAGIGLSTAPNPTVALVKTSTIVTFTKDEKQQQAYEQVITLNDTDTTLHPVQSLMIVANFRVHWRLYASAAVRVDEKLFEQPVLGATYRHPLGDRVGVNVTAGVMFSRETEILAESGFAEGQKIDPSLGLTADEIPTTTRYHRRFALLFSFDF